MHISRRHRIFDNKPNYCFSSLPLTLILDEVTNVTGKLGHTFYGPAGSKSKKVKLGYIIVRAKA